jgi:transposase-like protein
VSLNHSSHKIVDRTKIRDGAVANRPIHVAPAVTTEGRREFLGLWAGDGGEGAKHWLHILTEIKNRGVSDVLMLVCDGLKGLPEAVETVWPRTIVQNCVVHLLRNSFRYATRQDWDKIAKLLKPVYTAPTEEAALDRLAEFADAWGRKYPAVVSCGRTPGRSSPRSCGSTPRSAASSARRTRSSRSTPVSARRSRPAGTSRTSRPL